MLLLFAYLFATTHFFASLLSSDIPILPQPLVVIVPLISVAITGWLAHSALPSWANSIIALVVVVAVAGLWALFSNQLVGGLVADFVIIAAYSAALEAGPLSGLQQWLMVRLPSPLDAILGPSSAVEITVHSVHYPLAKPRTDPEPISLSATPPSAEA